MEVRNNEDGQTQRTPDIPPLQQIYFYLTGGCNLRCRHCWIEPHYLSGGGPVPALDPGIFREILDEALPLGLEGVKLTGGEPLLHPEIEQIIETVRERRIRLAVETNGTLCTPELSLKIAACEAASVAVSLDGCDASTHDGIRRREGGFQEALAGIGHLVTAGLPPQIIMTVMRRNKSQMAAMVRLAEDIGAASVKFNIVQPIARGLKMHEAGETLDVAELISLGQWVDGALSSGTTLPLCFHQPPAFRSLGRMFGETGDGCYHCGILGILGVLADGSYALCGIGAVMPEMVFGQARKDALKQVWCDNPVLQDIRQGLPDRLTGICATCVMKQLCLGACIAQNFYRSQDLWAPFWFCEEARRLDLFPESRLVPGGVSTTLEGGHA